MHIAEMKRLVGMVNQGGSGLSAILNEETDGVGEPPPPPPPPPFRRPYFDVGNASGKPGDTVDILVEAGCPLPMTGFHFAGGAGKTDAPRSGYGLFRAKGAVLGPFLRGYLKDAGAIHDEPLHQHDHFFSMFTFYNWDDQRALPEEWIEFIVSLFSIDQARMLGAVPIPSGTHLFTLKLEILPGTPSGEYDLTCEDEHYYTVSRVRLRDIEFSSKGQPYTNVECFGGKITVLA